MVWNLYEMLLRHRFQLMFLFVAVLFVLSILAISPRVTAWLGSDNGDGFSFAAALFSGLAFGGFLTALWVQFKQLSSQNSQLGVYTDDLRQQRQDQARLISSIESIQNDHQVLRCAMENMSTVLLVQQEIMRSQQREMQRHSDEMSRQNAQDILFRLVRSFELRRENVVVETWNARLAGAVAVGVIADLIRNCFREGRSKSMILGDLNTFAGRSLVDRHLDSETLAEDMARATSVEDKCRVLGSALLDHVLADCYVMAEGVLEFVRQSCGRPEDYVSEEAQSVPPEQWIYTDFYRVRYLNIFQRHLSQDDFVILFYSCFRHRGGHFRHLASTTSFFFLVLDPSNLANPNDNKLLALS